VISVAETTVMSVAATVPKSTLVAPVKPVPLIVTVVPPLIGPLLGEIDVTVGRATVGAVTICCQVPGVPFTVQT